MTEKCLTKTPSDRCNNKKCELNHCCMIYNVDYSNHNCESTMNLLWELKQIRDRIGLSNQYELFENDISIGEQIEQTRMAYKRHSL